MKLQELFRQLRIKTPERRQFVWIVDIEDLTDGDVDAVIARAECKLEDKVRVRDGVYIGTTTSLANQLQEFTLEEIDSDWKRVYESIDSFLAIASCA